MLGHGGRTWLAIVLVTLPLWLVAGVGAESHSIPSWVDYAVGRPGLAWVEAQSSLEAQLFSDKPSGVPGGAVWPWGAPAPSSAVSTPGGGIKLPGNVELRISFLYNRDQATFTPERPIHSHLLFRYAVDFGVGPNLQVGLSGFYYYPQVDDLFYQRRLGPRAMAWGPGVKYDLGRWSFTFRTQLGPGSREGGDLQNWFRVWYAF